MYHREVGDMIANYFGKEANFDNSVAIGERTAKSIQGRRLSPTNHSTPGRPSIGSEGPEQWEIMRGYLIGQAAIPLHEIVEHR